MLNKSTGWVGQTDVQLSFITKKRNYNEIN